MVLTRRQDTRRRSSTRAAGISPLGSAAHSQANGINGSGVVVGSAYELGRSAAALWDGGTFVDLGTLGGLNASAMDINDAGQIAGSSSTASGSGRAFLYENGSMRDLGTLAGASSSSATAINSSGQVVGWSNWNSGAFRAFLWSTDSGMQSIGGFGTYAMDINDAGQIAGHSRTASGYLHAFLYSDGSLHDLGTLGGARVTRTASTTRARWSDTRGPRTAQPALFSTAAASFWT